MRPITSALAGLFVLPAIAATPAHATTPVVTAHHGVLADYRGRTIDLADGWQGAKACAAIDAGDVRCYDTRAQMHDAIRAAATPNRQPVTASVTGAVTAATDCGGSSKYLALYSGTNYGGAELDFISTAGWVNLADFGFENTAESYANNKTCSAYLADGQYGGNPQLTLTASSKSADLGSWNNRASSTLVSL